MDLDRVRTYLLTLPHVIETVQFGGLVFWVGDKAIGGKMFAWMRLEHNESRTRVISFAAGPERYAELVEIDGIFPAPYVARIFWVAIERWNVFRTAEWEQELRTAHKLTFNKLTPRVRAILALPPPSKGNSSPNEKNFSPPELPPKLAEYNRTTNVCCHTTTICIRLSKDKNGELIERKMVMQYRRSFDFDSPGIQPDPGLYRPPTASRPL